MVPSKSEKILLGGVSDVLFFILLSLPTLEGQNARDFEFSVIFFNFVRVPPLQIYTIPPQNA